MLKASADVFVNILFYLHPADFSVEPVTDLLEMSNLPR